MAERGSGQTTKAMLEAPQGAVYVWCNESLAYPRHLARHLGRDDLVICRGSFDSVQNAANGTKRTVVVDHAWYAFNRKDYDMIHDFAVARNHYVNGHKTAA